MKSDLGKPFSPEISAPTSPTIDLRQGLTKVPGKPSKLKLILIILGVLIFGVVLVALGYFVIFPYFFPAVTPAPVITPIQKLPGAVDISPTTAPTAALRSHQSLLKTPAELQAQAFISPLDLNSLRQALAAESNNKPEETNILKEMLLSGASGQIAFSDTLALFIPEFTRNELSNVFEEDFTTFLYYNADGVWPAWIAKVKTGVTPANAKTLISRMETSSGLMNLFITNPGAPIGIFKTGQIGAVQTRYLAFPQKGASLNYAFSGNKLIISASFNGLKKILTNL